MTYTATQIAAALGSSRQAVQRALTAVPEHGTKLTRGNETSAWTVAMLPVSMQAKLKRRAKARGYRNIEQLVSEPPLRFESSIPVNQLAEAVQARCMKLRDALARPLAQQAEGVKGADLERIGLREYERVFGHAISSRHWRTILDRTLTRDSGEGNFQRLDLYIDDRPRAVRSVAVSKASPFTHDAEKILTGYASQVREQGNPTSGEKALLWNAAFEQALGLVETGMNLSRARRTMRQALWQCGVTLAKTEASLAELWRVKEAAWRDAEGSIKALHDGRVDADGNRRAPEIQKEDLDLVISYGVKFGGRVSQAWRHMLEHRLLSPEVQAYYEGAYFASKPYVPRTIRDAATPEVRMLRDIHHGPRTAELNGAFITRDWTGVAAGDWFQADDVTLNNYYYAPDDNGGLALMRGQVLLMDAHNNYARQRYRMIAPLSGLNARPTILDHATERLGREITTQKAATEGRRAKREAKQTEGAKAFSRLDYTPRAGETVTDKQLAAANQLERLFQEEEP